jgi:hypothetical protein
MKKDSGLPFALGAVGLLAAAGLLRGSQASGAHKKGSAAVKPIRYYRYGGFKPKAEAWGPLPPSLTFSTNIGIFEHVQRKHLSPSKANDFFRLAVEATRDSMWNEIRYRRYTHPSSVELRENHLVYSGKAVWMNDNGPGLTQGRWRRSDSLDKLKDKVEQLALLERSWDKYYKNVPEYAGPPFDLSGGINAWFHALLAFDIYPSTDDVADSSWSDVPGYNDSHTKDRNFRSKLRGLEKRGEILWFAKKLNPDTEEHEQEWNLWVDPGNPNGYYYKVYLGTDPLNIYDALRLFEKQIKENGQLDVLLEYSYTTKRWGPPPSKGDDNTEPVYDTSSMRLVQLSDPTVKLIERDVLRMADKMDQDVRFSNGKIQDRLRKDVVPFLLSGSSGVSNSDHDQWFDRVLTIRGKGP